MNKQVSPYVVAFILIAVMVAFWAITHGSIQVPPNTSVAQVSTASTGMADMDMSMSTANSQSKTVAYILKTVIGLTPPMAFVGVGGAIDDVINPTLTASVGDTVHIFFGVGGPNNISSIHVIDEMFDRVYDIGSLTTAPMTNVQTTLVPPGGATMVEVPGRYILVDHALSRMERGLAGYRYVDGADQPDVFHGDELTAGSGH